MVLAKYKKCREFLRIAKKRTINKRLACKYSDIFFNKIKYKYQKIDENTIALPYINIDRACEDISNVYRSGTFQLYHQYPMIKIMGVNSKEQMIKKMNLTFMHSRRKR